MPATVTSEYETGGRGKNMEHFYLVRGTVSHWQLIFLSVNICGFTLAVNIPVC